MIKGKVVLWRKLLDESGFPDSGVKKLMEGAVLVGKPTKSELCVRKEVPATTSVDDLLASSPWRNPVVSSHKDS